MDGGSVFVKFKGEGTDLLNKVNNMITDIKSALSKLDDNKILKGIKSFTDTAGDYYNTLATASSAALIGAMGTVTSIMNSSIKEAAKLEQSIGGVQTVFAESAEEIKAWEDFYGKSWDELQNSAEGFTKSSDQLVANAKEAYKTAGVSANEYMEQVTSFGARLMQATNNNSWEAMEIADMAFTDMSDNANKFGTDLASIEHAYQGFAKANYTMLDNLKLGYGGTKTEMARLLEDAEKISGIKYDISNLADIYSAIHVIQEEMGVTGTTANEAATTITGSLTSMKAAWTNFLGGMGSFESVVDTVIVAANNMINKFVEMAPAIIDGVVKLITQLSIQLPSLIERLLPSLIASAVSLINGLVDATPRIINALLPMLPVLTEAFIRGQVSIIQNLATQLPTIIPLLVQAILDIIPVLIENLPLFAEAGLQLLLGLIDGMIQGIGTMISNIPKLFQSIITGIKNFFGIHSPSTKMLEIGKMLLEGLKNGIVGSIGGVVNKVKEIPGKILDKFKNGFSSIGNIGKNLLTGLTNGISNNVKSAVNAAKNAASSVLNKFKSIFGVHSPSTEFMWVGEMNMEGLNKGMKEMSPEIQKSIDGMFNLSPSMSGAVNNTLSPNIIVNANLNYETDPLGQVVSNIKTFSGGAKNDYNYGMGGM